MIPTVLLYEVQSVAQVLGISSKRLEREKAVCRRSLQVIIPSLHSTGKGYFMFLRCKGPDIA